MEKTYHGSCHCGAVQYEATLDLSQGTSRCNCTYCTKTRNWNAGVEPQKFKLMSGKESLSDYGKDWGAGNLHHLFCKHCGTNVYGYGHIPEMGGDFVSIHVNTLNDASNDELLSGPIRLCDGRNDNWLNPPADTRTL
jgi:hypothetical protein